MHAAFETSQGTVLANTATCTESCGVAVAQCGFEAVVTARAIEMRHLSVYCTRMDSILLERGRTPCSQLVHKLVTRVYRRILRIYMQNAYRMIESSWCTTSGGFSNEKQRERD